MDKTIIYFLRHGEVENPTKILYGRLPGFSLSKSGEDRIKFIAEELKDKKIEYLFTSPLQRARQTVNIIAKILKLKPKVSSLLIETKLLHQGVSLDKFKKEIQPNMYDEKYVRQGQESIAAQGNRMNLFVQKIKKQYPGKRILAVSHGDPIMILKAKLLGILFTWEFKKENYLQTGNYIQLVCKNNSYEWK